MTLVRIAARMAAIQAITNRTLVGGNVLDSQIGALEVDADGNIRTDQDMPFISVYAEAAKAEGADTHARSMAQNGDTEFVFEVGITAANVSTNDKGESVLEGIGTPATDAGFEFYLDMVCRQISDALSDPDNEWAEIFRKLTRQILRVERARTASADQGLRLAAHQIKITAAMVTDPVRGGELKATHGIAMFFAKASELDDDDIVAQVELMQAQISGDETAWQTALRRYGMTRSEADNMLVTPPAGAQDDGEIGEVVISQAVPAGGEA